MPFKSFFDEPENYKNRFDFYEEGGSPLLLKKFKETIEEQKNDIEEINISWYLYNNQHLHDYLKEVAATGITVNVITIPLEGYDHSKPKIIKSIVTGKKLNKRYTKYNLARIIYGEMYRSTLHQNFNLYIFPHLYVRSARVKKFSRGSLPYSLHIKSAYIKKKNGYLILLSSCNLAVRDLVKNESMIIVEDEPNYEEYIKTFYKNLIRNSINIKNYKSSLDTTCNTYEKLAFNFSDSIFITAPFYDNSANLLEKTISQYIISAKKRIIVCAQHLAAFNYGVNAKYHSTINKSDTRKGMLGEIITMANKGVKVTCLSQTFSPLSKDEKQLHETKYRTPVNTRNFQHFFSQIIKTENAEYFVNENIHSKFIIIDNTLIYCSYNFTPTQFIFLDNVNITKFKNMPNLNYSGIHCEVGMHLVIKDQITVKAFENNVANIKRKKETIQAKNFVNISSRQ
ncbi:phospholipase D-like domain-containing protein [Maribacter sp. M208]|uniref:phospholipase D-like domain-containing protein n=1 Tax=Maribacter huludaoensis TaxID=3030010 RepID=UPI0023EDE098|nr:phospholipase D-like domain-containing protein [Maribacter huludaoensis]MDF4221096.1 phospholipase D-like domain-containing protein [Maribacter huludaoensis]